MITRFKPLHLFAAAMVGGIVMFACTTVEREMTPLDDVGISTLPDEDGVRQSLLHALGGSGGFYLFPSKASRDRAATPEEKAALTRGPHGILVYSPPGPGAAALSAAQIATELLLEMIEACLVALLMAATALRGYPARVAFAAGIGLTAVLTTHATYWTFYRFPLDYTLASCLIDLIRYIAAGAAIAWVLKPAPAP